MKSLIILLIFTLYLVGEIKGRSIRVECKRWKEACIDKQPIPDRQPIKSGDYKKGKNNNSVSKS